MKYLIPLIFVAFVFIVSCDEAFEGAVLEVNLPDHQPQLTPYAFFYEGDSILTVKVETTVGILDSLEPESVDYATVEIYKNTNLIHTLPYVDSIDGYQIKLSTPFYPEENEVYKLSVSAPGFETTSAIQTVPKPVELIEITRTTIDTSIHGIPREEFIVTFKDKAQEQNYYKFSGSSRLTVRISHSGELLHIGDNTFNFESNDPNYNEGIMVDNNLDGLEYVLKMEANPPLSIGGSGFDIEYEDYFYINSAPIDFIDYSNSLEQYEEAIGNPFAEPVILYSNMSNRVGMFCIFSTVKVEI